MPEGQGWQGPVLGGGCWTQASFSQTYTVKAMRRMIRPNCWLRVGTRVNSQPPGRHRPARGQLLSASIHRRVFVVVERDGEESLRLRILRAEGVRSIARPQ